MHEDIKSEILCSLAHKFIVLSKDACDSIKVTFRVVQKKIREYPSIIFLVRIRCFFVDSELYS